MKVALVAECRMWMAFYSRLCNSKYKRKMEEIFTLVDDVSKRMSREVKDLDDIRIIMGALKEIREKQIDVDMSITPIEVNFFVLLN